MTSSTVRLRIQELAEAKGLTFEELSKASGVSLHNIQAYATIPVKKPLTEEIAAELREIAIKLNVPVIELAKPIAKRKAFQIRILEKLELIGLTLEELSQRSGIHPAIIAFYSTQPICQQKLDELESKKKYLSAISEILNCCVDDIKVEVELPLMRICLEEWAEERGLTLEDVRVFTGLPMDFIDLIATQPFAQPEDINEMTTFFHDFRTTDTSDLIPITPKQIICSWVEPLLGKQKFC